MSPSVGDAVPAARTYLKELSRSSGGGEASDAAIDELLALAKPARFDAGAVLTKEGDAAQGAFLIVEGRLRASVRAGEHERVVNEAAPGEIIGEAGVFITGARRSATLTAVVPTTVLGLGSDLFRESVRNPALIALEQHFLRTLARRIANTDALITRAWRETESGRSPLDGLAMLLGGGA